MFLWRSKALIGALFSPFVSVKKGRIAMITKSRVPFAGNMRVVADALLAEGADLVVYKDGRIANETRSALEQAGARVISGFSFRNLITLLQSETVIVSHSIRDAHISSRKLGRKIINIWHGVPLKRIELLMHRKRTSVFKQRLMSNNAKLYDHVLACNEHDRNVMAEAFGIAPKNVFVCGLPRFDYLRPETTLPADLKAAEQEFQAEVAGRKIIVYAPTFREKTASPLFDLSGPTLEMVDGFARQHGVVFAIRPHPYDKRALASILKQKKSSFIDASSQRFPEPAIILRHADMLITDYSSIWVDFLITGRPLILLARDFAHYINKERGFIHDLNEIFPGPMFDTWEDVLAAIQRFEGFGGHETQSQTYGDKLALCKQVLLPDTNEPSFTKALLAKMGFSDKVTT